MPDQCPLTPEDHAEALHQAFQDGYAAGQKAPRGIADPCPGSGRCPGHITSTLKDRLGTEHRGTCSACSRDYRLTGEGKVWRHRKAGA